MSKDRFIIAALIACLILVTIPFGLADTSKDGTLSKNLQSNIPTGYHEYSNVKIRGVQCGSVIGNRAGTYAVIAYSNAWSQINTGDVHQNQAILMLCYNAYTSGKTINIITDMKGQIVDAWMIDLKA